MSEDVANRRRILIDDRTTVETLTSVLTTEGSGTTELGTATGLLPPVAEVTESNAGNAVPLQSGAPTKDETLYIECRKGGGVSIPRRQDGPQMRWKYYGEVADDLRGNGFEMTYGTAWNQSCALPSMHDPSATGTGSTEGVYNSCDGIECSNGNIVVVGERRGGGAIANYGIDVAYRLDGTNVWKRTKNIVDSSTGFKCPRLVMRPDGFLIMYYVSVDLTASSYGIGAMYSTDFGVTWDDFSTSIADSGDLGYSVGTISVAYANGNFTMVVADTSGMLVTFLYSIDGGSTFKLIRQIDNGAGGIPTGAWNMPKLLTLVDETLLLVVWDDHGSDGQVGIKCTRLASGLDLPPTYTSAFGPVPHIDYGWNLIDGTSGEVITSLQAFRGYDGLPYVVEATKNGTTYEHTMKVFGSNTMDGLDWSSVNSNPGWWKRLMPVGARGTTGGSDDQMFPDSIQMFMGTSTFYSVYVTGPCVDQSTQLPVSGDYPYAGVGDQSIQVVQCQGNSNLTLNADVDSWGDATPGIYTAAGGTTRTQPSYAYAGHTTLTCGWEDGKYPPMYVMEQRAGAGSHSIHQTNVETNYVAQPVGNTAMTGFASFILDMTDSEGYVGTSDIFTASLIVGSNQFGTQTHRGCRMVCQSGTPILGQRITSLKCSFKFLTATSGTPGSRIWEDIGVTETITIPSYEVAGGEESNAYEFVIAVGNPYQQSATADNNSVYFGYRRPGGLNGDRIWTLILRRDDLVNSNAQLYEGANDESEAFYKVQNISGRGGTIRLSPQSLATSTEFNNTTNATFFRGHAGRGLPISALPNAITRNMYCGFAGSYVSYDDNWLMRSTYQYPAQAIIPGNRGIWRTPVDGQPYYFLFTYGGNASNPDGESSTKTDAAVLWGTNFLTANVYLSSVDTVPPTGSPDIELSAAVLEMDVQNNGGGAGATYTKALRCDVSGDAVFSDDQWAGYMWRWTDTAIANGAPSKVYKIKGNTSTTLFCDFEGDGWTDAEVSASGGGVIFTDKMFATFSEAAVPYVILEIPEQPGLGEYIEAKGWMFGYTHKFDQNWEWAMKQRRIANVETVESPGGQRYVYEKGPARSEIDVEWTGVQADNQNELLGLWERCKGGAVVVGVIIDTDGSQTDFIPARCVGDYTRTTQALYVDTPSGPVKQVVDVDSITFSEEIK